MMARLVLRAQDEIKRAMRRRRLYQRDLAARLGVSQAAVSAMLNPRSNMTLDTLDRVCRAMGARATLDIHVVGDIDG